jgi:hypothetical protein
MTTDNVDARATELADEESGLKERLRAIEDEIQTKLRHEGHAGARIDAAERDVRKIVLRLVEIEREQIELRVAASL